MNHQTQNMKQYSQTVSNKESGNSSKSYNFNAEIDKVLQMMIHSIYTNKDIFLRELISNASDACDKLKYIMLTNSKLSLEAKTADIKNDLIDDDHNFAIHIKINKDQKTLTIEDNGIGMTSQELIDNLGTIASSGTQKFLHNMMQNQGDGNNHSCNSNDYSIAHNNASQLIGQFGVGFYSAFMVAESVDVYSTSAIENTSYLWHSDGKSGFTIVNLLENENAQNKDIKEEGNEQKNSHLQKLQSEISIPKRGTKIVLKFKDTDVNFLDSHKIKHIVKTYSDHIAFPIYLDNSEENELQQINQSTALWMRSKNDISANDYKEFYHHISHMPDEPWMISHHKMEGHVDYTSLLYIPSTKPFDLFHPDRQARVKLYVKRVFITDEGITLIPSYLRFLRGVIDSEDLPLNISRETLQNNSVINKIRKSVVNRLLKDLKKQLTTDTENFDKFWQNFGEVVKEGLCEPALEEKEQLLEICKFHSMNSGDTLITFDQYIENMIDGQNEIFFLTGTNLESLKQSPQLEGFIKRGIDVLLLHDYVDDFWINVINQYKNNELKSITAPNIDLNKIKVFNDNSDLSEDIKDCNIENKDEINNSIHKQFNLEKLIQYLGKVLGSNVRSIQVSNKLVSSPACLALPEGSMNTRLEKILIAQKQLNKKSSKILEINPHHPVIIEIGKAIEKLENSIDNIENHTSIQQNEIDDLIWIIFDQARLVEGEEIDNPCEFVNKINKFLLKIKF